MCVGGGGKKSFESNSFYSEMPTLVVEPVRAPNTVHCHKWDRTLHILMWVCVQCTCGKCGDWDGVKITLNVTSQFLNSQNYK